MDAGAAVTHNPDAIARRSEESRSRVIGLGLVSLVIAVIQDWHYTKRLQSERRRRPFNLSLVVAALVALIGVFTFMSVLLRIGPF